MPVICFYLKFIKSQINDRTVLESVFENAIEIIKNNKKPRQKTEEYLGELNVGRLQNPQISAIGADLSALIIYLGIC